MKKFLLIFVSLIFLLGNIEIFAQAAPPTQQSTTGIAKVASVIQGNLGSLARLLTGASYLAGMAFAVGAIVKFKAHKDNPTQIPIGTPIALLFVGAALIFIPAVFRASGQTLFGASGQPAFISGVVNFQNGS